MTFARMRQKLQFLLFRKNIKGWLYILLLVAFVGVRFAIAYSQRVFLLPEGSGIDDMLMIRGAQSITDGNWLGEYGAFTMAKNMGFAVWLAVLHILHIPVLLGNAALWIAACLFSAYALRPLFKGNIGRLVVFVFLAFQPFSYAFFTQRVYRDAVFPAFSLLFFAGFIGLCLRFFCQSQKGSILTGIVCGIGFAGAWLCREDGTVLMIFAVCAAVVLFAFLLLQKPREKLLEKVVSLCVPFVVLGLSLVGFSSINYMQYGVFMVNDMTEGSFQEAYGSMVAVSLAETGYVRFTPVTNEALEKMYEEVPLLAQLRPQLESATVKSGFGNAETGNFGGSFYFGLRYAASLGGYTPTAPEAQVYWAELSKQIEQAVQEGRLQSANISKSTVPRWDSSLLVPTLGSTKDYFVALFTFQGTYGPADIRPQESIGPEEKVQDVAEYLYSAPQTGYVAGTGEPFYNTGSRICYALCDVITWVYRIVLWALFLLALVFLVKNLVKAFELVRKKRKNGYKLLAFGILTLGLLCSTLLRVVVCGYMEAAAFDIGVYLMYLAGAVPPLFLFILSSFGLSQIREWQEEELKEKQNLQQNEQEILLKD